MSKVLLGICVVALVLLLVLRNRQSASGDVNKKTPSKSTKKTLSQSTRKTLPKGTSSRQIKKKIPEQKQAPATRGATEDFRSVTIRTKLEACNAAIALKDQVFLAREAPSLPLAQCDANQCTCRYSYLDDRRQEDRRTPYRLKHGAVVGGTDGNRRNPGDRRKN